MSEFTDKFETYMLEAYEIDEYYNSIRISLKKLVSVFNSDLLADNQNLIEAINRHIIKQTGNDTLII